MEKKEYSIDLLKAILTMFSTALLAVQHIVGLFAKNIEISYIPLSVTFLTIFIGSLGTDESKWIKRLSLIITILIVTCGCVIYSINGYNINMNEQYYFYYKKVVFFIIGILSLMLSITYINKICGLKE